MPIATPIASLFIVTLTLPPQAAHES
jgi:hypothetical protein